jgi:hypothetical protein
VRLIQDDYALVPIIERTALLEWRKAAFDEPTNTSSEGQLAISGTQQLPYDVRPIPAGYVAFDQVHVTARVWADEGLIDGELLPLLDPADTDRFAEAVALGLLPALGMNKRTGTIIHLAPSAWRKIIGGFPQSPWVLRSEVTIEGDGDSYLPLLAQPDLARALQANTIPPDPAELPPGWTAAVPILVAASPENSAETLALWMRGYAEGFKANGKILKREEAIHAAMESQHCRYRQAQAAFASLPYPELRNVPRTVDAAVADTGTPAAR